MCACTVLLRMFRRQVPPISVLKCHPSKKRWSFLSQLAEVLVLIYGPDLVNVSPDAPGTIQKLCELSSVSEKSSMSSSAASRQTDASHYMAVSDHIRVSVYWLVTLSILPSAYIACPLALNMHLSLVSDSTANTAYIYWGSLHRCANVVCIAG